MLLPTKVRLILETLRYLRDEISSIHTDGLMQKRRNSSALAMELRLFGIKPSI